MNSDHDQRRIDAAVELGFLSDSQLTLISAAQQESKYPGIEIAIRKGFLTRKQLQVLDIFSSPLDVVPGYRIDGLIGQGGVGIVFKATQIRMDRPVAIKVISSAASRNELTPRRFEREAQIVGKLHHPNIIAAIDFGVHQDQLYLAMEFVDGVDAEQHLATQNSIPEPHAWVIARQVCHALDNANQMGIIHRDIKPANLILTEAPSGSQIPPQVPFVKIADFGLAKFKQNPADAAITIEDTVSGTPYYMSPEQVNAADVDHRSDIYSLGMTIWHLVTGCPPITGTGPVDVMAKKMKIQDDWLAEEADRISESGFELLAKMCRHNREERVSDYGELDSMIGQVIDNFAKQALPKTVHLAMDERFTASTKVQTIEDLSAFWMNEHPASSIETRDYGSSEFTSHAAAASKWSSVNKWKPFAIGGLCIGLALVVGAWLFGPSDRGNDSAQSTATIRKPETVQFESSLTEFDGPPQFLFNGLEVDPTQGSTRFWDTAKGLEGENVLAGTGTREFLCRDNDRVPLRYFLFECGFRHHEAESVQFALRGADEQQKFRLNIMAEEAVLETGSDEIATCPLRVFDETSFGYHKITISAQPDHWRVELDSKLVGQVPRPAGFSEPAAIDLIVQGEGPGHFEGIRLWKYKF